MNPNPTNGSTSHAIRHRIEIEAPTERLFSAVAEQEGLAAWWTPMVEAEVEVGSVAKIRFGDGQHGPDMRIEQLEPGKRIVWTCIDGPWPGHRFTFDIEPHERGSVLRFTHDDWAEADDFYMHCNAKWGFFLAVSLKRYLETGEGQPHPHDPSI